MNPTFIKTYYHLNYYQTFHSLIHLPYNHLITFYQLNLMNHIKPHFKMILIT